MFPTDPTAASCNSKGIWDPQPPTCWRHCALPNVSADGTLNRSLIESTLQSRDAVGIQIGDTLYVRNGSTLKNEYVICPQGHVLANENSVLCYNGTFLKEPHCIPAPCRQRPPNIQYGLVRFTRMLHGYRARYSCHPGYQLHGNDTSVCAFGVWRRIPQNSDLPVCVELVCGSPRPELFANGIIYMLGIKGKYEVQLHQTKFQHSDVLEFVCNSGYKLLGTTYQTCVDGAWSPPRQPICIFGEHTVTVCT
jgi:hypothetical protein